MEHISKFLGQSQGKHLAEPLKVWSKALRPCNACNKDYEAHVHTVDGKQIIACDYCPACREKRRNEFEKNRALQIIAERTPFLRAIWLKESGIPLKYLDKTLSNFESESQPKAFQAIKDYTGETSLVLLSTSGIYGIGKTHLCTGLVRQIINTSETMSMRNDYVLDENPCPVYFTGEDDFISGIRYTFNNPKSSWSEEQIYDQLTRPRHLIIDDVGKLHPKDYGFINDVYYRIINTRYEWNKPIVLTTNMDYDQLEKHIGGACADRLREMCGKDGFIKMTGASYRKK